MNDIEHIATQQMPCAVLGPGALGMLFAARLALADTSPLLIDYRPERADALCREGLHLLDAEGEHVIKVKVTADASQLKEIAVVFLFVKSNATEDAAAVLARYLPDDAAVVTVQNGLGNVETLQLYLGNQRVYGGTTTQGALHTAPGTVQDTGNGTTILGRLHGEVDTRLASICQLLVHAGFAVSITDNLPVVLWGKVIISAAINPVGALTRCRNGELVENPETLRLMTAVAREAATIAQRHGILLPEQDWQARLIAICQATAENQNSMLQDVLREKPTEIDAINGAITRIAEQHAIPATMNRTLWYLVQALTRHRKHH